MLANATFRAQVITNNGLALTVQTGLVTTIQGAFTNQTSGASLGTIDNAGTITLTGDWTNNSANTVFSTNTGLVQIIGTTASQTIGGTNSTGFYDLTTNNTFVTAPQIVLGVNTTVKNTLTMTSGVINLAGFTKTLGTAAASPGALSHGATLASGWMYGGNFARYLNTVTIADRNVTGLFPMGNSTIDFRPFYVSAPAVAPTTGGTIMLSQTTNTHITSVSFPDGASTVERRNDSYWTMTPGGGLAGGTYNLSGEGTGFGYIGAVADLRLTLVGSVVGTAGANAGTTANPQVNRTGLTLAELSNNFYISSVDKINSPLPIELIEFRGECITDGIQLHWTTASELNNDYFLIEKSTNGFNWSEVAKVKGLKKSTTVTKYVQDIITSNNGLAYYRLSQADIGGHVTIFKTIDLNCNTNVNQMILYPNPSALEINALFDVNSSSSQNTITLINNSGQIIFENKIDLVKGRNVFKFPIDVASGSYTVMFSSDQLVFPAQKLMILRP